MMTVKLWLQQIKLFLASRNKLILWGAWFAGINFLLMLAVSGIYLKAILPIDFIAVKPFGQALIWLFIVVSYLGHFGLLAGLLWLLLIFPLSLISRPKIVLPLATLCASLAITALFIDAKVYALYNFHLNPMLFELLVNNQFQSTLGLSNYEYQVFALIILSVVVLEFILGLVLWKFFIGQQKNKYGKPACIFLATCLGFSYFILFLSISSTRFFAQQTAVLPLYNQVLGMLIPVRDGNKFLSTLAQTIMIQLPTNSNKLNYPKQALTIKPPKNPKNVLLIVIDSWRFGTVNKKIMPNTFSFAKQALQYKQHFSGGNATRPGMFSLFYGLPSFYWTAMRNQQQAPVVMQAFKKANYDLQVFYSSSTLVPAFYKTIFLNVPNLRTSPAAPLPAQADRVVTQEFVNYIQSRKTKQAFFSVLYYVMAHSFCTPQNFTKVFKPYQQQCSRFTYNNETPRKLYLNRYYNSLHFIDQQLAQVYSKLRQQKLLDNTIVIITGDHGQEFNDNKTNQWEHASNFTNYQVQTPLVIFWPGKQPVIINTASSHYDIAPMLLRHVLNNNDPISNYSIGQDLFARKPQESLIVGSYINLGIRKADRIISWYSSGLVEITDLQGKPLTDAKLTPTDPQEVLRLLQEYYQG